MLESETKFNAPELKTSLWNIFGMNMVLGLVGLICEHLPLLHYCGIYQLICSKAYFEDYDNLISNKAATQYTYTHRLICLKGGIQKPQPRKSIVLYPKNDRVTVFSLLDVQAHTSLGPMSESYYPKPRGKPP